MKDDAGRRPLLATTIARLLVEVSQDPQLRILFRLPPKEGSSTDLPNITPHSPRHSVAGVVRRRRRKTIQTPDSKSLVVMFPIVARPTAYRRRATAAKQLPNKK
jgi:hypothetical protein